MKRTVKLLVFFALAGVLMTYSGCGSKHHDPTPPADLAIDKLTAHTWKVSAVTLDGGSQTTAYSAFTLKFTGSHGSLAVAYATTGRPALSPWDAAGNFTLNSTNPQTVMVRNDGTTAVPDDVPFNYTITDTQLNLIFSYNGTGFTSRTEEVKGQWIFTLTAQ